VIGYFDDITRVTVSRPRALDTPESKHKMNRGIETSSIPRFGGCAGANFTDVPRGFRENPRSDCGHERRPAL